MNFAKTATACLFAATVSTVALVVPGACYAATPATEPTGQATTSPAATQAANPDDDRAAKIGVQLIELSRQIKADGGTSEIYSDASKRVDVAPRLVPLLKQQTSLLGEYITVSHGSIPVTAFDQMRQHNLALLYLLGDPETTNSINRAAQSTESDATLEAFTTRLLSQWIAAGKDVDAQTKLVDQVEKLDLSHPSNVKLTMFTFQLSRDAATDELGDRLMALASETMKNPAATALQKQVPMVKRYRGAIEAALTLLKSHEGKPLEISGRTPDGTTFSTADWKGKVILVDCWATWCAPCVVGLPRVKDVYEKYHKVGLEIVGVSSDYAAETLTAFTTKNAMPWPQLLDAKAAAETKWNTLATGNNVYQLPTVFLIDKKGVCRSVLVDDDFETLIPRLLAE